MLAGERAGWQAGRQIMRQTERQKERELTIKILKRLPVSQLGFV